MEGFFKPNSTRGRKPKYGKRQLLNAVFYLVKSGIQWRMMPKDLPPWKTVYTFFRRLCLQGTWEKILDSLNKMHRRKVGRNEGPSLAIVDSQSAKTQYNAENKGFDGGKKIKGRKRHLGVDILGNLLSVLVRTAQVHDTIGDPELLQRLFEKHRTIQAFCGDGGYRGTSFNFVETVLGLTMHITKKIGEGFNVISKRWIVERTIAWINNSRRLSKDFEIKEYIAANMIRISMIKLTLMKSIY